MQMRWRVETGNPFKISSSYEMMHSCLVEKIGKSHKMSYGTSYEKVRNLPQEPDSDDD